HRHEALAVALEALVPLAIPVRVRDDEGAPALPAAHGRDRARREKARRDADGGAGKDVERVVSADDDARERRGDGEEQREHAKARRDARERERGAEGDGGVAGRERKRRPEREESARPKRTR